MKYMKKLITKKLISVNDFELGGAEIIVLSKIEGGKEKWITSKGVPVPSYIDVYNTNNFSEIRNTYEVGDYVFFNAEVKDFISNIKNIVGKVCYVTEIIPNSHGECSYKIIDIKYLDSHTNNTLSTMFYYYISGNLIKNLKKVKEYWFINSSAQVHKNYEGVNFSQDKWLEASSNYFKTKEAAITHRNLLLKNFYGG